MPITRQKVNQLALSIASLFVFGTLLAPAQVAARSPAISFSVVSVRPSAPDTQLDFRWTNDGFVERGNPLGWLVQLAYGVPNPDWILGVPTWVTSQRFDVLAKVDDKDLVIFTAMKPEEKAVLLQTVLKDRFALQAHDETRVFPQYSLHVAKNGPTPSLRPAVAEEEQVWKITPRYHLVAKKVKISELCAALLSSETQAQVVDETGLAGAYDFELSWKRPAPGSADGLGSDEPEIFEAVKQQLGFELIRQRASTRVLVIDSVKQLIAN
jgi:uncharacterized protein (TIGR03435 family)